MGVDDQHVRTARCAPVCSPLPGDYDGPIFICDIDDTIRDSRCWRDERPDHRGVEEAPPIPGSDRLLWLISDHGVPIVYLTAALRSARPHNIAFLRHHFPPGTIVDFPGSPSESRLHFKDRVLREILDRYPKAHFFCLGDDGLRDPLVYKACAAQWIRTLPGSPGPLTAAQGPFQHFTEDMLHRVRVRVRATDRLPTHTPRGRRIHWVTAVEGGAWVDVGRRHVVP